MDTLECMRTFARVVIDGGFAPAARQLDLTTSQVSRAISYLESRLGTRLLQRTTRRVALTEAGERYLAHCQRILADIEDAEAEAIDAQQSPAGTLRIHALANFGQHHVVPTLLQFQARYPAVKVDLTFSHAIPDLIREGYDASLIMAQELPNSGLVAHRIGCVVGVMCASPGYIARHGLPRVPTDLEDHVCLQLTNPVFPTGTWRFVGDKGEETVTLAPSVFSVNLADSMELIIRQGIGIGLLPAATALPGLRSGALVRVLPQYALQPLNVYARFPSRRYVEAKVRTWIDMVREYMPVALAADAAALDSLRGEGAQLEWQ